MLLTTYYLLLGAGQTFGAVAMLNVLDRCDDPDPRGLTLGGTTLALTLTLSLSLTLTLGATTLALTPTLSLSLTLTLGATTLAPSSARR